MEKFAELREVVEGVEVVDAHAHNLVALDSTLPFLQCFSEAYGDALLLAPHALNFKRGIRDIAELYGSELSLDGIQKYRKGNGLQSISSICFKAARIAAILIDDGIEFDKMHDIEWHRNFAPVVGRILRIEHLAEKILDEGRPDGSTWTLDSFTETFIGKLKSVANKIVGLKSIAAYRSGLEINTNVTRKEAQAGLVEVLNAGSPVRITNKNFIDYLFVQSLDVAIQYDLPMQIHTGFGDKDLDLRLSNPLHLRTLLEDKRFSKCRLVLLHASYPFSKEASYLASIYSQVYLDFGLAVPKLSVHGMISSVKELLELAPIKKVMFSTDGYAFPETFYLGAKRAREVVFSVLRDACIDGDLSIPEAIEAAKDIFSENAKKFYKINFYLKPFDSKINEVCKVVKMETDTVQSDVAFVRIIWVDVSGQHRCRAVPRKRFHDVVVKNGLGLTVACMAMSSATDCPADETNLTGVGEIRLIPDLSTKCIIPWAKQEEMVLGDMHLKPGEAWEYCPREALRRVSKILKYEFNLVMYAGFESEFYLLKSALREGKEEWFSFDTTPYCFASAFDAASPVLHEVVAALQSLNIAVEQYKFFVDGEWRHDEHQPFVSGNYGVVNTVFLAREPDVIPAIYTPETPGRSSMDVDNDPFFHLEAVPRISEADIDISRQRISVFLSTHTAYELLPESGKVIALDVNLPVKQAFHILYEQGIPVAPLWDFCKGQFVGVLSALDFILILRELGNHGSNLTEEELDTHSISAWKEGKSHLNRQVDSSGRSYPRCLIHAGPYDSLKDVALKILQKKVATVPIIHSSSQDGSFPQLLHLASLSEILKCICRHFRHSSSSLPILQQPICLLPLGTWVPKIGESNGQSFAMLRPNAPLSSALSLFVQAEVSSIPIVDDNDSLLDIYCRSDITALAKDRAYAQIRLDEMSIHQALQLGQDVSPYGFFNGQRCQMCLRSDPLHKVMERLANPGVRRLVIVEAGSKRVEGIVSLSDVFRFLLG